VRKALGWPEGVDASVMAIHTFGEHLNFHPHLRSGLTTAMDAAGGSPRHGFRYAAALVQEQAWGKEPDPCLKLIRAIVADQRRFL